MYINPTFIENLKYSDALPEYWIISIVIGLISWSKMMICLRFPHVYDLETQSNRFAKYLRVRANFTQTSQLYSRMYGFFFVSLS